MLVCIREPGRIGRGDIEAQLSGSDVLLGVSSLHTILYSGQERKGRARSSLWSIKFVKYSLIKL